MTEQEITAGWWLVITSFQKYEIVHVLIDNDAQVLGSHNHFRVTWLLENNYKFIRKLDLEALAPKRKGLGAL